MSSESTWGESARKSHQQAIKHADKYLASVDWSSNGGPFDTTDRIRLFGNDTAAPTFNSLIAHEVMDADFDQFGKYFSTAKHLDNPRLFLSLNSASRYLSALKMGITRMCMQNRKQTKLTDRGTKLTRDGMVKLLVARAIRDNKATSQSHATTSTRDIVTVVTLCFWAASFCNADMLFLFLSLRYLAGRCGEIGRIPRRAVSLDGVADWDDADEKIPRVWFWRPKTTSPQEIPVFTHKNEICLDWPFALAYSMVMNPSPNEFLFSTFASTAAEETEQELNETDLSRLETRRNKKITEHFNAIIARLVGLCQELELVSDADDMDTASMEESLLAGIAGGVDEEEEEEKREEATGTSAMEEEEQRVPPHRRADNENSQRLYLNPKVSSHSQKRNAVNTANAHPLIQTTWLCLMSGWVMKAVHTIFDYLSRNRSTDEQVALVWSGWNQPGGLGRLGGGHPPMIRAIASHGEYSKVRRFIRTLFVSYESESVFPSNPSFDRMEIFEFAFAAVLLRLRAFINLLLDHPLGIYGSKSDFPDDEARRFEKAFQQHPFLETLKAVGLAVDVSIETLLEWCDLVDRDFVCHNFVFAAWSDVLCMGDNQQFQVDTQNLAAFMEAIIANHRAQDHQLNELQRKFDRESGQRAAMQQQLDRMEASLMRMELAATGRPAVIAPEAGVGASRRVCVSTYVAFPRSLD